MVWCFFLCAFCTYVSYSVWALYADFKDESFKEGYRFFCGIRLQAGWLWSSPEDRDENGSIMVIFYHFYWWIIVFFCYYKFAWSLAQHKIQVFLAASIAFCQDDPCLSITCYCFLDIVLLLLLSLMTLNIIDFGLEPCTGLFTHSPLQSSGTKCIQALVKVLL